MNEQSYQYTDTVTLPALWCYLLFSALLAIVQMKSTSVRLVESTERIMSRARQCETRRMERYQSKPVYSNNVASLRQHPNSLITRDNCGPSQDSGSLAGTHTPGLLRQAITSRCCTNQRTSRVSERTRINRLGHQFLSATDQVHA